MFFEGSVVGNNITESTDSGIFIMGDSWVIGGNYISNNTNGIRLEQSPYNSIHLNTIIDNENGIYSYQSSNNTFDHNNFINNTQQTYVATPSLGNVWDDGYPYGGNYWSNYNGTDSNGDGLGDTPHIIDEDNTDTEDVIDYFEDYVVQYGIMQCKKIIGDLEGYAAEKEELKALAVEMIDTLSQAIVDGDTELMRDYTFYQDFYGDLDEG